MTGRGRKAADIANGMLDRAAAAFFLLVFLLGLYSAYDAAYVYSGASARGTMVYRPDRAEEAGGMLRLSDDVVCWLTVDGTTIDHPVMQAEDNRYYLNTDPYGRYSLSGSIFLDCRCAADFSDPVNLVYGHHMAGGAMFGALDRFLDGDYAGAHRSGTLLTAEGREYRLTCFAAVLTDASEEAIFDPVSDPVAGRGVIGYLRERAEVFFEPASEHVLLLTTCRGASSSRLAVAFAMEEV